MEISVETGTGLLQQLALDLHWSWNHSTDELWSQLEPELWLRTHNPWVVLQTVSRQHLAQVLNDPAFHGRLEQLMAAAREAERARTWFEQAHADSARVRIAYFSMEYMLSEALPIYAGGLGNVAGDQLKAASDLGVPIVGIGLLYQQGYFRQVIDREGAQQALFPYNDPGQLPVTPLRQADGEWLRLRVALPGYTLWLRTWEVKVGRLQLYLLDSNDVANYPAHRSITSELYGGGLELRLQQEMVLGLGGWRLLHLLGLRPQVCHLNEGHAAFAILERARAFMKASGQPFEIALAVTRAGNVFTTHTAVPAGFDSFPPQLIAQYLGAYANNGLHISLRELLALGRRDANDDQEPFNMAYLAVRGSGMVNGVSRLHGEVSRRIFQPLFPRWPAAEIPIGHVTNGVHMPSWDSVEADELWTRCCGKGRWIGTLESVGQAICAAPDEAIWQCRAAGRRTLVAYARERLATQLATSGATNGEVEAANRLFSPDVLTLGFARRFATYKRPNLLLHDPERLVRLLTNAQRPVQLILAGKAHPDDAPAQALIRDWVQFVRRSDVRAHAVFLADYDMLLTEQLVQGVDVWINTPRRPWEACGTSGMKVLVNGGLNLSELDGWWAEAYTPEVGWALGDAAEHGDDPAWDAREAAQLYDLLERQIVPEFYTRDESGIPRAWVARVRASMSRLTPTYSANRMVREYLERCYLPAAAAYERRAADNCAIGVRITNWRRGLEQAWSRIRFGGIAVETAEGRHRFRVEVQLNGVDPAAVRVELCAVGPEGAVARYPMTREERPADAAAARIYVASVPATQPASLYTPRVVPHDADLNVPLELPHIMWQR
jgi:starch phosphorylase